MLPQSCQSLRRKLNLSEEFLLFLLTLVSLLFYHWIPGNQRAAVWEAFKEPGRWAINSSGKKEWLCWPRRWYQTPGNWAYKLVVLTTQWDKCLKLLEGNTNKWDYVSGPQWGCLFSLQQKTALAAQKNSASSAQVYKSSQLRLKLSIKMNRTKLEDHFFSVC